MKKLTIMTVAVLAAACVFAQEEPRPEPEMEHMPKMGERRGGPRGERHGGPKEELRGGPMGAGPWVAQMLAGGDNLEKIGVTDEALRESLRNDLAALKEKSDAIEKQIREVSREQAKLMRELMKDRSRSADEVLAKIDEVSKLRAEQGRLAVQSIVLLRDKLSAEQLQAAHKLIMERGRARGRMRMEEHGEKGRHF